MGSQVDSSKYKWKRQIYSKHVQDTFKQFFPSEL